MVVKKCLSQKIGGTEMGIKKQCFGNFCTIESPNCKKCRIDESMNILKEFIRIREPERDINSIYKQNTSENSDSAFRKIYTIAGLEDPMKEIKTNYNHN